MRHTDLKHLMLAVTAAATIVAIGLWSWNTLAALFDFPAAELRHALAALILLSVLRGLLLPAAAFRRRSRQRRNSPGTPA
jgi:uncharacterized integral membrane protein